MKKVLALAGILLLAACSKTSAPAKLKPGPSQYKVRMATSKGDVVILVHRDWAPNGADHFYDLVTKHFYDGNRFFRTVPKFIVQWGMNGDPAVNKQYAEATIPDDPPKVSNKIGTVVFAATGQPNSRSTQLFINLGNNSGSLDAQGFTPFGEVIQGMETIMTLNMEYAEKPDQEQIAAQGNAYLQQNFPRLDYIKTAQIEP